MLTLTMDLPFLHGMLLLNPPSVTLQNALSTIMLFHRVPRGILTKELTSQQEKYESGPRSWSPLVLHVAHQPEAAGLTERWGDCLKTQFLCALGDSSLQG